MKHLVKNTILFLMGMLTFTLGSFAQNNTKLLDLTSNTYSNGKSFYVNIGSQMQVTSNYTFEAWLFIDSKPSGTNGYFPIIMDRRTVFSFILIDDPSSSTKYCLRFVARNSSDNIIASVRSDGNNNSTYSPMNIQDWYHIAVSRDGTTTRLFINGTMVDSSTDPNFVLSTPSGNPFNCGCRYWGTYDRFMDGALDEVRYSNTCRYSSNFLITTATPPHPISGDPNTILLFNFNSTNLTNSTSANTYTAWAHGTLSYADWDGFPNDKLPLPIEYLDKLSAQTINHNKIQLTWSTASEIQNRGFEIQGCEDGKNWQPITFINGAGNSNSIRLYKCIDYKPSSNYYYRLKQIDYDGKFNYSNIAYISSTPDNKLNIFPNPATTYLQIGNINPDEIKRITIYNILGKTYDEILFKDHRINISHLSSGNYLIRIEKLNGSSVVKEFLRK